MSRGVLTSVTQCAACLEYFTQEMVGEDGMCDACGEVETLSDGEHGINDSSDMLAVSGVIVV